MPNADMVTPERPVVIDQKPYTLGASVGVLKQLQNEFGEDVYDLATSGLLKLRFDQLARVIQIAIGEKSPSLEIIEHDIVRVRGLDETKYLLMEWLYGAVSTDGKRAKNVEWLRGQIEILRQATVAVTEKTSKAKK